MNNYLSDQLQIETTLNISIDHTFASIGERIVASLLDFMFFLAYYIMISILFHILGFSSTALVVVFILPVLFYDLVMELSMDGQSWGKKIMKIKVVKADGSEAGFIDFLIRWIFRLLENLVLMGTLPVLLVVIRGKGQRLGDMAAGTAVVRVKNAQSLNELVSSVKKTEEYVPRYESVVILSDKDIYTIREVLQFVWKNFGTPEANNMALKAQSAIEKKLDIHPNSTPIKFLEAILKDYEYLHSENGSMRK